MASEMLFSRFGLLLSVRLVLVFAALGAVVFLVVTPGYPVAAVLAGLLTILLGLEVFRFVRRTNRELARFLDAVRYTDFNQRFDFASDGAGFKELGDTFTAILTRFRENRESQEAELKHFRAIVEHVPVPLVSIHGSGDVELWNNAARRLFGGSERTRLEELSAFGTDLPEQLKNLVPGRQSLIHVELEDVRQTFAVLASEITVAARSERLVSLLNIQSELDGMQLSAWQDLVRVLTHEIMNSITPVSSLAQTAEDLLNDIESGGLSAEQEAARLVDSREAVSTLARRARGLTSFVESYRQLTRMPDPERGDVGLLGLFTDVKALVTAEWGAHAPKLELIVEPESLSVHADRKMLEQVLLNLLHNSEQALEDREKGVIEARAGLNPRGRVMIEVTDNGPGISEAEVEKIFVPFYTTRRDGTGVGLAFSRQVMMAHGGSLTYSRVPGGGARFSMVF